MSFFNQLKQRFNQSLPTVSNFRNDLNNARSFANMVTSPVRSAMNVRSAYAPTAQVPDQFGGGTIIESPQKSQEIKQRLYNDYKYTNLGRNLANETPIFIAPNYRGNTGVNMSNYGGQGQSGFAGYYGQVGNNQGIVLAPKNGGLQSQTINHEMTHALSEPLLNQPNIDYNNPYSWPTNQEFSNEDEMGVFNNWNPQERMAELGSGVPNDMLPQNVIDFYSPLYRAGGYYNNPYDIYSYMNRNLIRRK